MATAGDVVMHKLVTLIEQGLSDESTLPNDLREYNPYRNDLYMVDGVVVYKERVIVPPNLINDVLHAAHHSVNSMLARTEASVFWPGITRYIKDTRDRCNDCYRMAPSQPSAPPAPPMPTAYPFQCVCVEITSHSRALTTWWWTGIQTGRPWNALQMVHAA